MRRQKYLVISQMTFCGGIWSPTESYWNYFQIQRNKKYFESRYWSNVERFHNLEIAFFLDLYNKKPGSKFFEMRRYFSKIAGNSADTAVNPVRNDDAPLS